MFLLLIHGTCDCFSVPGSGRFCKFITVPGHVRLKYRSGLVVIRYPVFSVPMDMFIFLFLQKQN